AVVEDDRQNDLAAERVVAGAEHEAVRLGETAMHGSLLSLHARSLTRLGFQNEADAALAKAADILEAEGTPDQRLRRRYNEARITFDRGRAREAEVGFAGLVAEAEEIEETVSLADRQAYWARALFMVGQPREALENITSAIDNADHAGTSAPIFLSHMARSEGAHRYGQYEEALTAADDMLGFVLQQLPAWENAARFLRGRALLGLGRIDEAAAEANRALELCPEGINGWRWRLKIRVLQLQIVAERGDEWPQPDAEDLTDELLQGGWLDTAADLMATRASRESDEELARQAAGLALEIGIPMAAAEAIQSQGLWSEPGSAAVVAGVRTISHHMPQAWEESWSARPEISAALAIEEVTDEAVEAAEAELVREIESALVTAGLADAATTLSPAQRRELGLIRRRPVRRALTRVLAAAVVVVLGAVGALVVLNVTGVLEEDEPAPITFPTIAPTIPPPSAVQCPAADQITLGDRSGISTGDCVHWTVQVGGAIHSSPNVHGIAVMFGSRDFSAYNYDTTTGVPIWQVPTGGDVDSSPALGDLSLGEGGADMMAFIASGDGCVYRRQVLGGGGTAPDLLCGGQAVVGSAAVAGRTVVFSNRDGAVYASDAEFPGELWRYPLEGSLAVESAPAIWEGTVFVGIGGSLHAIDLETGSGDVCFLIGARIAAAPVVVEGIVYVGSDDGNVWAVEASNCSLASPITNYIIGTAVTYSPAVADGNIYIASTDKIIALTLATNDFVWTPFQAGGPISASPTV
ncbi:MAG: PQQ-binding-like beta-propeller repeat protein, partial [Acidimicrobiia bacterium]